MSSISAGLSQGTALVSTGDTTGELVLKTNGGTTALTIDTSQNVNIAGNLTVTGNAPGGTKWQTPQTSNFNAVAGRGYPVNTTSGAITATLPASPSVGDTISFVDYAGTFASNNLTLNLNGQKINSTTLTTKLQINREAITIVYIDSTQGWVVLSDGFVGSNNPISQAFSVEFLVIAGGGAGGINGNAQPGGGGAGGYISSVSGESSGGGTSAVSPLNASLATNYTVTVGAGGATGSTNGANSVFATTTATGGGRGNTVIGSWIAASSGGSGGGGGGTSGGAAGTAGQGRAGGNYSGSTGGGGGGASTVGSTPGAGGTGVASSVTGSSVTRASGGAGGSGGGAGAANTGNGGGAGPSAGAGGSGVVILRYPSSLTISNPGGGLTLSTATVGGNKVTTITAGTGNVSWSL